MREARSENLRRAPTPGYCDALADMVTTLLELGRPIEALAAAEEAWAFGAHRTDLRNGAEGSPLAVSWPSPDRTIVPLSNCV